MPDELLPDRHFRLRRASQSEYPRVQQFALAASAASTPPHPLHRLLDEIIKGKEEHDLEGLYVIEDMDENNAIIAAAASLLHGEGFVEICGATIVRHGFGLQAILTQVRTFHADALNSDLKFFCVVPCDDQQLCDRMSLLGFGDWPIPESPVVDSVGCALERNLYRLLQDEGAHAHRDAVMERGRRARIPHSHLPDTFAIIETDLMTVT